MVKMVRAGWGLALLAWPAPVLHRLGLQADGRSCVVARVLGCRHLVQATVQLLWPVRRVQMAGAAVDVLHGASMAGLAVLYPMRRKAAATSAVDAGAWAAFGALSIRTICATGWLATCMETSTTNGSSSAWATPLHERRS